MYNSKDFRELLFKKIIERDILPQMGQKKYQRYELSSNISDSFSERQYVYDIKDPTEKTTITQGILEIIERADPIELNRIFNKYKLAITVNMKYNHKTNCFEWFNLEIEKLKEPVSYDGRVL